VAGRDHDAQRREPWLLADPAEHLAAVHARHDEVEQDGVEALVRQPAQRRGAVGGDDRRVALELQGLREVLAERLVVVDDADAGEGVLPRSGGS
jgi:hypothetical protein